MMSVPLKQARGFYENRIFPWLNDRLASDPVLEEIRAGALAGARGRVVEIGFGSGLNLRHYPRAVRSVVAVEPNLGMHARAAPRISDSHIPVDVVVGTAENLFLPDGEFDTAVSVLTLCSVTDPARVLSELRRVLREDGRLLVMEHGLSRDPGVARWQNRLNRIQNVMACGCNLNRSIATIVESHGFRFQSIRNFYAPRMPRTHGWLTVGTAIKA
jgi:ubiquinone/menaquinone biosynthesis C-methylase UbiE